MRVNFALAELPAIHEEIGRHLRSLPGPTDSFLEEHVRASQHYRISLSGNAAGFAAIHGGNLITQFALVRDYQRFGQAAFQALKELEQVRAAFVPTCDEFYLSHALDDYRQLGKQAYFFEAGQRLAQGAEEQRCLLQPATPANADFIREGAGELFDDVSQRIEAGELFLTQRNAVCVGIGSLQRSRFRPNVADIGMFTLEQFRGAGVGTATIALLMEECSRLGLRPVSGCWYHNHPSKRALERAGMVSRTRLLRIEY